MNDRFFSSKLDPILHSRLRLAIVAFLAFKGGAATFVQVKEAIGLTNPGSLSRDVRRLRDVHYVTVKKGFVGDKPRTTLELTHAGRHALQAYRDQLADFAGDPAPRRRMIEREHA
jgi:hypothetical protein